MLPYFFLLFVIFAGHELVSAKMLSKGMYCAIVSVIMIALCGGRDLYMGLSDTKFVYENVFLSVANTESLEKLWDLYVDVNFGSRYVANSSAYAIMFLLLAKISSMIINDYQFFLLICAAIYFIPISLVICRHSKVPMLSFIVFIALNGFSSSFYLVRHEVAMGILLIAWLFFCAERKKMAAFFVIVAAGFHISALIFLVVLLFDKVHFSKRKIIRLSVLCAVIGLLGKQLVLMSASFVGRFFPYYLHYLHHDTGQFALLSLLALFVALFCFQKYDEVVAQKKENGYYANALLLYIAMLSFQIVMDEFNRLALFFVIAPAILLPNTLVLFKKERRSVYAIIIFGAFSGYFFCMNLLNYNMVPYKFFMSFV